MRYDLKATGLHHALHLFPVAFIHLGQRIGHLFGKVWIHPVYIMNSANDIIIGLRKRLLIFFGIQMRLGKLHAGQNTQPAGKGILCRLDFIKKGRLIVALFFAARV